LIAKEKPQPSLWINTMQIKRSKGKSKFIFSQMLYGGTKGTKHEVKYYFIRK
jgi:hypothetical protein